MNLKRRYSVLNGLIASVWMINGLLCKVLNLVPRHEEIVGVILSSEYSRSLTLVIGASEIAMALWIISRYKSRINAILQIGIIATMNIIEFILVPEFLLWGRFNSVFAILFILLIYYNAFILRDQMNKSAIDA